MLMSAALFGGCKRHPPAALPDAGAGALLEPVLLPTPPARDTVDGGLSLLDAVDLAKARTFTSLKDARRSFDGAYKLELADQNLAVVPGLGKLTRLQVLNLSHNPLIEVSALASLTHLQRLDLSFTRVRKMPVDFGRLVALVELDLSHTPELATVPFDIGELKKLKILRVGSDRLRRLPDEITGLSALTFLSLRGCRHLTELPAEMNKLVALTDLDLTYTGLPQTEFDRIKRELPLVKLQGSASELPPDNMDGDFGDGGSAASDAEGAATTDDDGPASEAAADLPCSDVLTRGRSKFLAPFLHEGEEEGSQGTASLERAVGRYVQCREERSRAQSSTLPPRVAARLVSLKHALAQLDEAMAQQSDDAATERALAPARRADLLADVTRESGKAAPEAVGNDTGSDAVLLRFHTKLAEWSRSGEDVTERSEDPVKDAAQQVESATRALPAAAAASVYRYLEALFSKG